MREREWERESLRESEKWTDRQRESMYAFI